VLCSVPVALHSPTTHDSPGLASHTSLLASPLLSSRLSAPPTDLDSPIIQFALAGTPRPVLACFWPALACAPGPAPHRTALPLLSPISTPPLDHQQHSLPPSLPHSSLTPHSLTTSEEQHAHRVNRASASLTARHSDTRLRKPDSSRSTPGPRFTRRPQPSPRPEPSTALKSTPTTCASINTKHSNKLSAASLLCQRHQSTINTSPTSKQHTSATVRRPRRFWPCETSRAVALSSILVTPRETFKLRLFSGRIVVSERFLEHNHFR
jgi:hypothetical protein